jgi:hypothetical protein
VRGQLRLPGLRRGVVLVVGDVLTPVDCGMLVVDLVEREVDHQSAGGSAVPVLLVGLDVDAVARADYLDRPPRRWTSPIPSVTKRLCPSG